MATKATTDEDMAVYDPDTDPRETAGGNDLPHPHPATLAVNAEASWLLQVSIKTPGGTLINVRGMNSWDLAAGLQSVQGLAHEIKATEDSVGVGVPPALAQMNPRPVPQAPPQQQPRQQYPQPQQQQTNQPTCNCGYPARFVAGGISRKTNKAYHAFWACGNPVREAECSFRADA